MSDAKSTRELQRLTCDGIFKGSHSYNIYSLTAQGISTFLNENDFFSSSLKLGKNGGMKKKV